MLISTVQQSNSVKHIRVYILFHYGLSWYVPCDIQLDLVIYPFYIKHLASANLTLLIHSSPHLFPLATTSLLFRSVSLFLFCR